MSLSVAGMGSSRLGTEDCLAGLHGSQADTVSFSVSPKPVPEMMHSSGRRACCGCPMDADVDQRLADEDEGLQRVIVADLLPSGPPPSPPEAPPRS